MSELLLLLELRLQEMKKLLCYTQETIQELHRLFPANKVQTKSI